MVALTKEKLDSLTKEQLRKVSEHFNIELNLQKINQLRKIIKERLVERLVLTLDTQSEVEEISPKAASTPCLTEVRPELNGRINSRKNY